MYKIPPGCGERGVYSQLKAYNRSIALKAFFLFDCIDSQNKYMCSRQKSLHIYHCWPQVVLAAKQVKVTPNIDGSQSATPFGVNLFLTVFPPKLHFPY